ncbi:Predicted DNA-binding protein, MmcQ/YjbR family [Granulicella rosea]|uniref:Predicted DNA-binding protein, MmcQ/YjbR family n=1 Tax=Granulicella rosea TaxID=474952 RepID=A0A239D2X4_9BACT|nr:MmcQ/YjbR family DNA-binding protein [Granulicella rosea]SNS26569.1 Predicted DNA-binding protein, MmcQ/YjbR family [Granulicella rosea]
MNAEQLQTFVLGLPDVVETMQWGANLVFWVGDKAVGGKMFALVSLEDDFLGTSREAVISFAAGPERCQELLEIEGVIPAPYFARIHWVAVRSWDVFRRAEWEAELTAARNLTEAKLPKKVRETLALPKAELKRVVAARRKVLAEKAAKKAAKKAKG